MANLENEANAAPIERLLVYANIKSEYFHDTFYNGVQTGLMGRLVDCGIAFSILPTGPVNADGIPGRELPAAAHLPSTVMSIRISDRKIVVHRDAYNLRPEYTSGRLFFELKLFDVKSEKETWLAKSGLRFSTSTAGYAFVDDEVTGMHFANSIFTRIQHDGMLNGCRIHEAYTGCRGERREQLFQANNTADKLERWKMIKSAPSCE